MEVLWEEILASSVSVINATKSTVFVLLYQKIVWWTSFLTNNFDISVSWYCKLKSQVYLKIFLFSRNENIAQIVYALKLQFSMHNAIIKIIHSFSSNIFELHMFAYKHYICNYFNFMPGTLICQNWGYIINNYDNLSKLLWLV